MTDVAWGGEVAGAVVAATDGSESSAQASEWAAEEAELENLPLAILHATAERAMPPDLDAVGWRAAIRAEGEELVGQVRRGLEERHRVPVLRSVVLEGDPRDVLLEVSDHARVLVVGSRGRGPLKSLLLGSVGMTMTQHARCPVVVAKPRAEGVTGSGVLVGTDLTSQADAAVEWAFDQAAKRGMPLTLMHAVFDGRPAELIGEGDPSHRYLRTRLEEIADACRARYPDVEVECQLRRGLADEALLEAAEGKDMVVVGKHLRRSALGLLDLDVSQQVLAGATRFVAIVPPGV